MNEKTKDCPLNVIILFSKMKILLARIRGLVTDVSCVESTASLRQVNASVHSFSFQFFYCSSFFFFTLWFLGCQAFVHFVFVYLNMIWYEE